MARKDPMLAPYYSTDLSISIGRIEAKSKEHAEEILNQFIDQIGMVMADVLSWDECDWTIQKNIYDKKEKVWVTK